jgi:4-hydroxy-3-polyprenylbenzoate decarboxylase
MEPLLNPWVVAISGASGVIYGLRLVKTLAELGEPLILTVTDAARLVIREELGMEWENLENASSLAKLFDISCSERIHYCHYKDLTAPIASGSFRTRGMIVVPCSVSSLSQIAQGASQNLLERAADVHIKERRKLVLVVRETPLSAIHLENMLKLSRLGVDILPASPGFYANPERIDDMIDFVVGKALDLLGVQADLFRRWKGGDPVSGELTEPLR